MAEGQCVFCDIIQGRADASIVYTDDQAVAFMDIRPVLTGHLLVVPRAHAERVAQLDAAAGGHLFQVGMRLNDALRRSGLACEGVNFFLADGHAAGQEVPHVHLHVLPRYRGDGFGFRFPPSYGRRPGREALDEAARLICAALGGDGR